MQHFQLVEAQQRLPSITDLWNQMEQLGFWDPMIARLPSLVAVCLYAAFVAPKFSPDLKPVMVQETKEKEKKREVLSPVKEVVGYGTFLFVIVGLLAADAIHVPSWIITLIGALVFFLQVCYHQKKHMLQHHLVELL